MSDQITNMGDRCEHKATAEKTESRYEGNERFMLVVTRMDFEAKPVLELFVPVSF